MNFPLKCTPNFFVFCLLSSSVTLLHCSASNETRKIGKMVMFSKGKLLSRASSPLKQLSRYVHDNGKAALHRSGVLDCYRHLGALSGSYVSIMNTKNMIYEEYHCTLFLCHKIFYRRNAVYGFYVGCRYCYAEKM